MIPYIIVLIILTISFLILFAGFSGRHARVLISLGALFAFGGIALAYSIQIDFGRQMILCTLLGFPVLLYIILRRTTSRSDVDSSGGIGDISQSPPSESSGSWTHMDEPLLEPTPDQLTPEFMARFVGRTGITKTLLLPTGKVAVDGYLLDAKSEGLTIIKLRQRVRVVGFESTRLTVVPMNVNVSPAHNTLS